MAEEENVQVVQRWIAALNAHDVSGFDDYRAPGYLFDAPDFPGPVGVEQEIAYTRGVFEAFSDLHFEVGHTVAQGDFVVVNGVMTGTNDGSRVLPNGQSMPATGKKASIPLSNTFQFANGKIVRNSLYYDNLGPMIQLGVMPGS
jgi:steroid delta-isomerase-like uncharacterized protein